MVDYSRWANMGDSDDEEHPPSDSTPAADFGRALMKSSLAEASPNVSEDEVSHILSFA